MTVQLLNTVKNSPKSNAVPAAYPINAFLAVAKSQDRIMKQISPIIKRAGDSP